jgi:hypothetical protein
MTKDYEVTLILNTKFKDYSPPVTGELYKLKIKRTDFEISMEGFYYPKDNKSGYNLELGYIKKYSRIFQDVDSKEVITILNEPAATIAKSRMIGMISEINRNKYVLEIENKNQIKNIKNDLKTIDTLLR